MCLNFWLWRIPFGGFKQSGLRREYGEVALENYREVKRVFLNTGKEPPVQWKEEKCSE